MTLIYIILAIQFILIIFLLYKVLSKKETSLIIEDGDEILFEVKHGPDWVIKQSNGKLITGIKDNNIIVQKSTI